MKTLLSCFVLGATALAGCVSIPATEIQGLENFQANCPDQPPLLSDAQLEAIAGEVRAASADELTEEQREDRFRETVLNPFVQRDLKQEACVAYERRGRLGVLSLGGQFNQAVRETR